MSTRVLFNGRSFPSANRFFMDNSTLHINDPAGDLVPLPVGHRRALFSMDAFTPGQILCYMVGKVRTNEEFEDLDARGRGGFALSLGDGENVFDTFDAVEDRLCLASMANSPFRAYDTVAQHAAVANGRYEVMVHEDGLEGVCITAILHGVSGCEVLVDYNEGGTTLYADNTPGLTGGGVVMGGRGRGGGGGAGRGHFNPPGRGAGRGAGHR
ncbi:hypothetical protein B484DRAFT_434774 [Ochromonadaceae sp. CCMP2298]|nr:hypothetical protein B484DRAFT_434774 [Ochromonadaceae sp. CCMP2298]